jgi:hypothetical protein
VLQFQTRTLTKTLLKAAQVSFAFAVSSSSGHATDWLQFGGDPAHSGNNAAENGYSTATGNRLAFPAVTLPTAVDSAPIFLGGVATSSGKKDLLFAVAKDGTLLALDAANGSVIWSNKPVGLGTLTTGAPAVDPDLQYVYAYGLDGKVHKYMVGDGTEIVSYGWPQIATEKPDAEKAASGVAIATAADGTTYLYSVTDSYFDAGDYQGHLTTINLSSGLQNVFNAHCSELTMHFVESGITSGDDQNDCPAIINAPSGQPANSGIWGKPGAVYDAGTNRVYIATGNGLFDPGNVQGKGIDWGDSVLALNPDGTGSATLGMPMDSYTPTSYANLLANDADLGSTSPAILPAPAGSNVAHLAMQGGKDGCVRLLNLDQLGSSAGPRHAGGELQAINLPGTLNHCIDGGNLGTFKTQAAVWVNPADASTWVFVEFGGIVAYQVVVDGVGNPSLSQKWLAASFSGTSPVVANATVYYVAAGAVQAFDATTGNVVWTDNQIGGIHWESPIVVNGRLYVFDEFARLWVYQLDGIFRNAFQ